MAKVARLDADNEEHQELGVAVKDADGDEEAENASHAAEERNLLDGMAELVGSVPDGGSGDCGAEDRCGVEAGDPT